MNGFKRRGYYLLLAAALWIAAAVLFAACSSPDGSLPVIAPRSIRVVMDNNYPPYAFLDSSGNLQGILVDQWKLWEQKTGIKVEIHAMDWGEALNRMAAGEFDVIDTIFYNESRAKIYDFSKPYATLPVPIFFHKNISGITGAESLKGFPVAVKSGDAAIEFLKSKGVDQILEFPSYEEIIKAAKEQRVIVFVVDQPPALYFLYKYGIQDQFQASEPLYSGQFHRAVRKGNSDLLKVVEQGFSRISKSEYAAIDRKWFGTSPVVSPEFWFYLGIGGGGLGFLILVLFIWNRSLQGTVERRTSEYKKAAEELSQSERKYRQLVDNLPGVVYRCAAGDRWQFQYISDMSEELTGFTPAELYAPEGKTLLDLFCPEERQSDKTAIIEQIRSKGSYVYDLRICRKDGKIRWVGNRGQAVLNGSGQILWIDGVLFDISERKQAEVELRRSEEEARSFSELLATLYQASIELSLAAEPDDLFRKAIELGVSRLGFDRMSIWILDESRPGYIHGTFGVDESGNLRDERSIVKYIGDNRVILGLASRKYPLNYTIEDDLYDASDQVVGTGEKAIAAIWDGNNVRGYLAIDNLLHRQPIDSNHRDVLVLYAQMVGHLDMMKRAEKELRLSREKALLQSERMSALTSISIELSRVPDTDALFRRAVELGTNRLGFDRMGIWLLDPDHLDRIHGTYGINETGEVRDERQRRLPFDPSSPSNQWIFSGDLLIFEENIDLMNDAQIKVGKGDRASVALWDGQQVRGFISVDNLVRHESIDQNQRAILVLFAQVVGHTFRLKNIEAELRGSEEAARRQSDRMTSLNSISIELSRAPDFDSLYEMAVRLGVERLGFDRMGIWLKDPKNPEQILGTFGIDEHGNLRDERQKRTSLDPKIESHRLILDENIQTYEENVELHDDQVQVVGRGDRAAAALWDGQEVSGFISVDNLRFRKPIDENQRTILFQFAQLVGHLARLKRVEADLRLLNTELERRVDERTAQLEMSNREMQSFSYSISHDLRAPLRALDGFSQILADEYGERLDVQAKHYLNRIRAASAHMAELIDALLKLSRISRSELNIAPINLTRMARQIAERLSASQPERSVDWVIQDRLTCRADPALMEVVLENLLGNAWKFTSHHPSARIEVGWAMKDGRMVYYVSDDGAGFDQSYADKLFGAFQRLHPASEFEGTGIGLAIVQRVIHRHGGEIWAEGAVDKGAAFYFTLPAQGG
ncbi:MAG TPA: transporter substrate-binding domain-containing protein [Anaerolineaceae bacterium]